MNVAMTHAAGIPAAYVWLDILRCGLSPFAVWDDYDSSTVTVHCLEGSINVRSGDSEELYQYIAGRLDGNSR